MSHTQEDGQHVIRLTSVAGSWSTAPERVFHYRIAESPAYGGGYGLTTVEDFFRLALTGGGGSPASDIDAMRVLKIVDAVEESARRERVVHLNGRGRFWSRAAPE